MEHGMDLIDCTVKLLKKAKKKSANRTFYSSNKMSMSKYNMHFKYITLDTYNKIFESNIVLDIYCYI